MSSTFQLRLLPEDRQESFETVEDLLTYLSKENAVWNGAPIRTLSNRFTSLRNEIQGQVNQFRNNPERLLQTCAGTIRNYENNNNSDRLIYSDTATGKALRSIGERFGQLAGEHAYYIFSGVRRGFDVNEPNAWIGVVAATLFLGASMNARADAEVGAATDSRARIESIQRDIEKVLTESRTGLTDINTTQSKTDAKLA